MQTGVILDKDGTLTQPISGQRFVQHPADQVLLPGVAERIAALHQDGATLVIVSNQGGVDAGHKSLEEAITEMRYCLKLLPQISYALFCPDFDGRELYYVDRLDVRHQSSMDRISFGASASDGDLPSRTNYRKPGPGMLNWAITVSEIERSSALMIGDQPEDEQAAINAQIKFLSADLWRAGKGSAH
jgi:D-glycero-D-manno-heptose 1,7-bisphosphate phosphatase